VNRSKLPDTQSHAHETTMFTMASLRDDCAFVPTHFFKILRANHSDCDIGWKAVATGNTAHRGVTVRITMYCTIGSSAGGAVAGYSRKTCYTNTCSNVGTTSPEMHVDAASDDIDPFQMALFARSLSACVAGNAPFCEHCGTLLDLPDTNNITCEGCGAKYRYQGA
jgi:uncharacterized Zn-finger protein